MQEAFLIVVADACSPSIRDMLACAGDELTRVGLFDAKHLRNLFIWVVEGFAQHVRGAFRRRERFEQHEDGELQRLAALGAQSGIGARIDWFGKPRPDVRFVTRARGLQHVDGEARCGRGEERLRIPDHASIGRRLLQRSTVASYL
jgi:hypothetical protein